MEAKETIEVEHLVLRNRDAGAQGVVILFAIGDDDVEAICGSALKDDDEPAAWRGISFSEDGADEETGNGGGARDGESAFMEKETAGCHGVIS